MKKTTVVNLYSGPGSGKSTLAANLFGEMKAKGYDVELVREWVKLWAYEKRELHFTNQAIVFGRQVEEETAFYGKVDVLITDCPILISPFYEQANHGTLHLLPVAKVVVEQAEKAGVKYWNLFLKRKWDYQTEGRWQDEKQAKALDGKMIDFLKINKIPFEYINSVEDIMLELLQ
jgi:nicotinamide riboside kinase